MTLEQKQRLIAWAMAHPEQAAAAFTSLTGAALSVPGVVYAYVKVVVQRYTGKPVSGKWWAVFDVVVEMLPNAPGAINRWVRAKGLPSIFRTLSGVVGKGDDQVPPAA